MTGSTLPWTVGVCSWSLRPTDPDQLAEQVLACGLSAVQLALDPLREARWGLPETRAAFERRGIRVLSGMMGMRGEDYSTLETIARTGGVRPDEHWEANREAAAGNARLARELGVELVSFHAGFLPEQPGELRTRMVERLRELVDLFAQEGVRVAFESGQESSTTLLAVLDELDRPDAGVNFDPANMLLYDRDRPLEALERLLPRVLQVHVKDARRTTSPGTWGEEVPVGSGEVDWVAFLGLLRGQDWRGDLVIEREAGEQRVEDVRTALETLKHAAGALS